MLVIQSDRHGGGTETSGDGAREGGRRRKREGVWERGRECGEEGRREGGAVEADKELRSDGSDRG